MRIVLLVNNVTNLTQEIPAGGDFEEKKTKEVRKKRENVSEKEAGKMDETSQLDQSSKSKKQKVAEDNGVRSSKLLYVIIFCK